MILVTGATGLVGSHLLYELTNSGNNVKAIRRTNSNTERVKHIFSYYSSDYEILFQKVEWIDADLLNYESLSLAIQDCEYVYHAAALVSFAPEDKEIMQETNIKGTSNIVKACIENKIQKLCYVSSIAALGRTNTEEKITEETVWNDSAEISSYSKSKYLSEQEVWKGINQGLNTIIVNPTIILGPGNWETGSPALFNTVWKGLKFYTEGITGFIDVRDVVKIMINLMNSDIQSQRFILNSENYCYKDLFYGIAEHLHRSQPKIRVSKFIAETAWRIEYLRCRIIKTKPLITKETATASLKKNWYSNEKIINLMNYKLISVSESVKNVCVLFLKDKKSRLNKTSF